MFKYAQFNQSIFVWMQTNYEPSKQKKKTHVIHWQLISTCNKFLWHRLFEIHSRQWLFRVLWRAHFLTRSFRTTAINATQWKIRREKKKERKAYTEIINQYAHGLTFCLWSFCIFFCRRCACCMFNDFSTKQNKNNK